MNSLYLIAVIFTLFGAIGGLCLKKASGLPRWVDRLKSNWLYFGAISYILSILLFIYTLQYLPYSTILPLTSFTYVWTLLLSYFFLNERLTRLKVIGVSMIIIGGFLIAY